MVLTCYIVDDEPGSKSPLIKYIEHTRELKIGTISAQPDRVFNDLVNDNLPALTFLNIDMPDIAAFKYARLFNDYSPVFAMSSSADLALRAFEEPVCDFLIKPFDYNRFITGINKVRQTITLNRSLLEKDCFFVKNSMKGKLVKIIKSKIQYIEAAQNYVLIYLPDQRVITYSSLGEIIKQLPGNKFSRIHKSYIVNNDHIEALMYGKVVVGGKGLPVGRAYKAGFTENFK